MKPHSEIHPGEIVEVLSEAEISATLDNKGTLEGLAFTPDMYKFCGQRFKVLRKLNNIMVEGFGMRQMRNVVILDGVTCNGEYNMGCTRMCHFIWKVQWLKRVHPQLKTERTTTQSIDANTNLAKLSQNNVSACQATSLLRASYPPSRSIIKQYLWSMEPGAFTPIEIIRGLLTELLTRGRRLLQRNDKTNIVGENIRTPTASLALQPGELVEVRSIEEIRQTLDKKGRNRGLIFSPEMQQYCGKRFKVLKRVDKATNEATGVIRNVTNTVILEGSVCDGKAHGRCQRMCPCLWREIWLRRVSAVTD